MIRSDLGMLGRNTIILMVIVFLPFVSRGMTQMKSVGTLFEQEAKSKGYTVQVHTIETDDFFFLTVFRLGPSKGINTKGKPILLTHGLDESADIWIINDPKKALALILADQGYDVWLLNNRGTSYSRGHRKFNVRQPEFWNFSFQEMAAYDIPSSLNYIQNRVGGEKITVIGHSQGSTQVLAALSDKVSAPSVNSKIRALVGLSPAVELKSVDFLRRQVFKAIRLYIPLRRFLGIHYPFLSSFSNTALKDLMRTICGWGIGICESIMYLPGLSTRCNDSKLLGKLLSVLPGGASFRSYSHFEQLYELDSEQPLLHKYDFGSPEANLRVYGTTTPPVYDWNKINVPIFFHSGYDDTLTPHEGISRLTSYLRRLGKKVTTSLYNDWDHFSPIMSSNPAFAFANLLDELMQIHS